MVDVVVPELRVRRLEHFARDDHPSEPGSLVLVADGESQLPHAAHLQELLPSVGRQSRKSLPQDNDVLRQMQFRLSSVNAPQRKVWAVNYLERNLVNLASGRHHRRPLLFPVTEVANIAFHYLSGGVGAPRPTAATVGRNPDIRAHDDG